MENDVFVRDFGSLGKTFSNTPLVAHFACNKEENQNYFLTINYSLCLDNNSKPDSVCKSVWQSYRHKAESDKQIVEGIIGKLCTKLDTDICKEFKKVLDKYEAKRLHFSLLNICTKTGMGMQGIEDATSKELPKIREILKREINEYPDFDHKACIDFAYYGKDSVALQVFLPDDLVLLLRIIQHHFRVCFPYFENKLKLYPNEECAERSVMNLYRYKSLQSKNNRCSLRKFFEGVDEFNRQRVRRYKQKQECETQLEISGLFLVYSDSYFDSQHRKIIDFFPFKTPGPGTSS